MAKAAAVKRTAVPHHRGHALRLEPPLGAPDPANLKAVRRWVRSVKGPTAVDLFCGAGGLSLGLRDAGFTVLAGADSDRLAVESHTGNLGGLGWTGDLTDPSEFLEHVEQWGIRSVDLVAGGPPCQPFSRAGSAKIRQLVRSGERSAVDPRASLWNSFMAVVERLRPAAVLIENVPDLPTWDNGAVLIGFYEALRELDYEVDARVLDAYRHGVPQHRTRLFIVATKGARRIVWPKENETAPTLRDAIGDLPPAPAAQRDEESLYIGAPESDLAVRMRQRMVDDDAGVIWDHITRDVRPDDLAAFNLMPEGGTYADLPKELQRYRSDIFTDKYKRLVWDEVSRTITAHIAKDGYWYIHPEQPRTLSIREAARIQTFPDDFRFAGQPSHRYRQIGNAVPPLLAEALGQTMLKAIESRPSRVRRKELSSFRDHLTSWHKGNGRKLPWRTGGASPWFVLMAELGLQRIRADQATTLFDQLSRLAPTPGSMAADPEAARSAMNALGLGWKADKLVEVAQALVEDHAGELPDTEIELRTLPGVGDYVAQSILCFGYDRRSVLIDSTSARVVSRVFDRDRNRRFQLRLDLYRLAGPSGPDASFNAALLDLAAMVCRSGSPRCQQCPVRSACVTGGHATVTQIPLEEG